MNYKQLYEKEKQDKEQLQKILNRLIQWVSMCLNKQLNTLENIEAEIFSMQSEVDKAKKDLNILINIEEDKNVE